eukprot:SAG11_NODE_6613_length_1279_cov_1.140678_1_plen_395_part_01
MEPISRYDASCVQSGMINSLRRLSYDRLGASPSAEHDFVLSSVRSTRCVTSIASVCVATGWGSDGNWVVCLPETCSGWHDGFEARLTGHVTLDTPDSASGLAHDGDGFTGEGVINFVGDDTGCGADGSGHCYSQNSGVESVTWTLYGCAAGNYDLGFTYSRATGDRPLALDVNGVASGNLPFSQGNANIGASTGAGGSSVTSAVWASQYASGIQLVEGLNTITLTAQGHSGPDIDFLEVNAANGRDVVSQHGIVHITADNGYILYINGDRIGAGGAALAPDDPMYERDGWRRTDSWAFRDPCETPNAYAIEAVDSEGVAAVMADVSHCGFTTRTSDDWKCTTAGCTPGATTGTVGCSEVAGRAYHVLDTPMTWSDARQACRQQFPNGDLASIHSQ